MQSKKICLERGKKKLNRKDIENRINGLNEYMLSDTDLELSLLKISSDYYYNKAIALVKKGDSKDWYSISHKNCFKNWNEADIFLDGFCLARNTNFDRGHER